jgi:hypothetical protein
MMDARHFAGRRLTGRAAKCPFTLLELMIAVAIFMLIVGALVGFSREISKSWARLHTEQARFQDLLALDRALDGILTNVVPFVWRDEDNQARPAFQGDPDRLIVACLRGCDDRRDGALRFVGLRVDNSRLVAVYQHRPFLAWGAESDITRASVLAEGVAELRFAYAKAAAEGQIEWLERWDNDADGFPVGIVTRVFWEDGRQESWVRRTAGSGFRERRGKWEPQAVGGTPQT